MSPFAIINPCQDYVSFLAASLDYPTLHSECTKESRLERNENINVGVKLEIGKP